MTWGDVLLEREFDHGALAGALSAAFGVPVDRVAVVASVEQHPVGRAPGGAAVVAEAMPARGDFVLRLSLYVVDDLGRQAPLDVTRRLCAALGVRALVPDESDNPYSMLLVPPAGEARRVTIDPASLENEEAYRLSRRDPERDDR